MRIAVEWGLRSGEVRGLRWPDVELAALRLHVRPALGVARRRQGPEGPPDAPGRDNARARRRARRPVPDEVVERGPQQRLRLAGRGGVGPSARHAARGRARVQMRRRRQVVEAGKGGQRSSRGGDLSRAPAHGGTAMLTAGKPRRRGRRSSGTRARRSRTPVYEHLLEDALLDEAVRACGVEGDGAGTGRALTRRRPPNPLESSRGGVPERSNGAVLKTADGQLVRGFKSHPRRSSHAETLQRCGVSYFSLRVRCPQ